MTESEMIFFFGEFFGAWAVGFMTGLFYRHITQLTEKI